MSGLGYISAEQAEKCELCGVIEETRPYGPNGEHVCFACGMKNETAARRGMARAVFASPAEPWAKGSKT